MLFKKPIILNLIFLGQLWQVMRFPFPDCVEIAHNHGISSVIQPGGSIKDNLSIDFCDKNNISMVHTGIRHFKH